jgi:quinoprotein dehydrogenase-associated probable ABC transporter substrate-binding protein
MSSRCRSALVLVALLATACGRASVKGDATAERSDRSAGRTDASAEQRVLRVCADPNNLPFSNRKLEGFENRIAELVGRSLNEPVEYTWWAQRRGFVRNTLGAHACDVVLGITTGDEQVLATTPYYSSTYVFVSRRDRGYHIRSFDDPRLRALTIGVHVIGDDYNALPPGVALARRGMIRNVRGYSIYGNYAEDSPPSALIRAVERGDVDVAIAWGPLAGYYAQRSRVPLEVTPVSPRMATTGIPFVYSISMGVRHGDTLRKAELERVLAQHHADVQRILRDYGVPLASDTGVATRAPAETAVAVKGEPWH